ncbi:hypothetical protein Droror1_Dr00021344 [Drosera rotundifolia]
MKRKKHINPRQDNHVQDIEILKAVAQAWLSHVSGASSRPTGNEFDVRRISFEPKPSRFKLEAIKRTAKERGRVWDFDQSLWDTYEILAVSKRLERGLVLDHEFHGLFTSDDDDVKRVWRRRESKNSLRKLFDKMSSRRFNHVNQCDDHC